MKKTAMVRREEGYMRMTIRYDEPSYKPEIYGSITAIEKKLGIYPEVIHRQDSDEKGFCTVEFSGDDYTCSRTCGEFIELMVEELSLEMSETD